MTGDEAGLLAAIRESPADDLPRMAWADWLDENGRSERAELVRNQLALARGEESGRGREQALLAEHGQRWLDEELPGFTLRTTHEWLPREHAERRLAAFRRGCVSVLFLPTAEFIGRSQALGAALPLARVQLHDRWPDGYMVWGDDEAVPEHARIPEALVRRLPLPASTGPAFDDPLGQIYGKFLDALAALSMACTAHAASGRGDLSTMKKVYTTGQVAHLCHVATRTVAKWFDTGKLKGYRIPGSQDRRIPTEQLMRFLRENDMPMPAALHPWNGDLETFTA